MDDLNNIVNLLGEKNKKRLQDGITDLLLQQVERDIEDKYQYEYILAFDEIFEEVKEQIEEEFKEKITKKYRKFMNEKLKTMFDNSNEVTSNETLDR